MPSTLRREKGAVARAAEAEGITEIDRSQESVFKGRGLGAKEFFVEGAGRPAVDRQHAVAVGLVDAAGLAQRTEPVPDADPHLETAAEDQRYGTVGHDLVFVKLIGLFKPVIVAAAGEEDRDVVPALFPDPGDELGGIIQQAVGDAEKKLALLLAEIGQGGFEQCPARLQNILLGEEIDRAGLKFDIIGTDRQDPDPPVVDLIVDHDRRRGTAHDPGVLQLFKEPGQKFLRRVVAGGKDKGAVNP